MSEPATTEAIEKRISALEARVLSLEGALYKRAGVGTAVLRLVERWPGPFTFQQIEEALMETRPELVKGRSAGLVPAALYKLKRQNKIICTHQGCGQVASIWELAASESNPCARQGRRIDYESGFRSIVRAALASAEIPEQFTLQDIRDWMSKNLPNVSIPYGSWSSTLYKLQQHQELIVVKQAHTVPRKVYARGPRTVNPTGDEMSEIEQSWLEFKRQLAVDGKTLTAPDLESSLERSA